MDFRRAGLSSGRNTTEERPSRHAVESAPRHRPAEERYLSTRGASGTVRVDTAGYREERADDAGSFCGGLSWASPFSLARGVWSGLTTARYCLLERCRPVIGARFTSSTRVGAAHSAWQYTQPDSAPYPRRKCTRRNPGGGSRSTGDSAADQNDHLTRFERASFRLSHIGEC